MNAMKTLLTGAALALSAVGANAATFASEVISADRGAGCTVSPGRCAADDRLNVGNAIDASAESFYALGFEGSLVVGFGQTFLPPNNVAVVEVTFDRATDHYEAADVYAVLDGVESFIGTIFNSAAQNALNIGSAFEYIKLVDVTRREYTDKGIFTSSFDGFDVGSISVAPVPLPAAGAMLLAGLGGFAALRRRKNAA